MVEHAPILTEQPTLAVQLSTEPAGYWRVVWRRFKQHRVAYVGLFLFLKFLLAVIVGPSLVYY